MLVHCEPVPVTVALPVDPAPLPMKPLPMVNVPPPVTFSVPAPRLPTVNDPPLVHWPELVTVAAPVPVAASPMDAVVVVSTPLVVTCREPVCAASEPSLTTLAAALVRVMTAGLGVTVLSSAVSALVGAPAADQFVDADQSLVLPTQFLVAAALGEMQAAMTRPAAVALGRSTGASCTSSRQNRKLRPEATLPETALTGEFPTI